MNYPKGVEPGWPASPNERYLRRLLALRSGMQNLYYDDGEAQAEEFGVTIDFMREPVDVIDMKLRALNIARIESASKSLQDQLKISMLPAFGVWQDHGSNDTMRHPEASDLTGGSTDAANIDRSRDAEPPKINVMLEVESGDLVGTSYINVKRVEKEDDGSFTAVIEPRETL